MSLAYYQPEILDQVMNGVGVYTTIVYCKYIRIQSELWTTPSHITVFQAYLLWQPFRLPGVNSNNSNNKSVGV